jgi:hypothetical protein
MQIIIKSLFIGAILALSAGAVFAADSVVGTWSLNLAKSTFSPDPAPKSETRTYAESSQGTTMTSKTTAADGKESTTTLSFKDDGKPSPVTGNPDYDTVTVTRVDANTIHGTQKKAGAVVGTVVRTVSGDGKTLTLKVKGTHADGVKFENVLVFDRK